MGNDYIGETKMMDNGLNATIIAFRDFYDIDIELENHKISTHQTYMDFVAGDTTALGFGKRKVSNRKTKKNAALTPAVLYDYLYVEGTKDYGQRRN